MNKRILLFVLVVSAGLSATLIYSFAGNRNNNIASTPLTVTAMSSEKVIRDLSKEFSKKYNKPLDVFKLSLDTDLGSYAKGSVLLKEEGGGGIWFGAKVNDVWQLVYDGNGIIPCSDLKQYPDFPSSLIPQCFDDNINMLINR